MVKKAKYGSVRRFGPRYGRTTKEKVDAIEAMQRKKHKCPYCTHVQVKRIAAGIWQCKKCEVKFASKAYSVAKQSKKKDQHVQETNPYLFLEEESEDQNNKDTEEKGVKYKDAVEPEKPDQGQEIEQEENQVTEPTQAASEEGL